MRNVAENAGEINSEPPAREPRRRARPDPEYKRRMEEVRKLARRLGAREERPQPQYVPPRPIPKPKNESQAIAARAGARTRKRRRAAWWAAVMDMSGERFFSYRQFYWEFLSRCYMRRLKDSEWKVLCLIFDRTLQWRKVWERIPMRHFIDGMRDADGFQRFEGTGLKKDSIRAALAFLEEKGLIESRQAGNGVREFSIANLVSVIEMIEEWEATDESMRFNYRAKWPGTDGYVEICSKIS